MKRLWQILAILVLGLGFASASSIYFHRIKLITDEPRLERILRSKGIDGRKLAADFSAPEFILVNFWASWCPPCLEETPSLIRFARAHQDRFLFLSVSQDSSEKEFKAFMKAFPELLKASALLVLDSSHALGNGYQVDSLPESFVYSTRLKKYFRIPGAINWIDPGVMSQIENAFKIPK